MFRITIPALIVLAAYSLSVQAERLTPTPEAGLWRSESRVLTDQQQSPRTFRAAQQLAGPSTHEYRALLDTAVSEAAPDVVLECIPANEASALGSLFYLQGAIQRKLPDCELNLEKLNRSALKVVGNCNAPQGFDGPLHGFVEFVSAHEIHASFLGSDASNDAKASARWIPGLTKIQRHDVHRWTSPDCGHIKPKERISF